MWKVDVDMMLKKLLVLFFIFCSKYVQLNINGYLVVESPVGLVGGSTTVDPKGVRSSV